MRVYLSNLGCKLNQAEIEGFGREFTSRGHQVVSSLEDAQVHVVNTCTVTHVADRTSRKLARRGGKLDVGIRTVLTGCYATSAAGEAAALAGVDLVVDNAIKHRLVHEVETAFPDLVADRAAAESPYGASALAAGRARAAVKVEDGCNMRCSFCIIPFTRGAQTSRPPCDVVDEVRTLVEGGLREVVLTGVQISSYQWRHLRLVDLVERVLEVIGPARLRLTSIAPWAFDPRLLDLLGDDSICPHVHLSLQAGCDDTLARMRRPYDVEQFEDLVRQIRSAQPTTAVTTDVIVGFPGESDEDFATSLATVERIGFARTHVFPYSPRPGTAAERMARQVPPETRSSRMRRMLEVAEHGARTFEDAHLGRRLEVLWESDGSVTTSGTSANYLKVVAAHSTDRSSGTLRSERIQRGADDRLWAA